MKNLKQILTGAMAVGGMFAALAVPQVAAAGSLVFFPGVEHLPPGVVVVDPAAEAAQAQASIIQKMVELIVVRHYPGQSYGLEKVTGGYRIRFDNYDIYYSPATGAHEVHGDIRAKYNAKGGPDSDLGLPVTDETGTPDGQGRYNHFYTNGSIYWHPNTGPMEVHGGIRGEWATQGWERGGLGYPTTDERVVGPSQWVSDFQNGVLYWEGNSGQPTVNASLSKEQMAAAVRGIFEANKGDGDLKVGNCYISDVTDTGYGFWQSRNRLVTFHFDGWHDNGWLPDTNYNMDLRLLFWADRQNDGGMHLFVGLDHWHIHTSGLGNGSLLDGLKNGILKLFAQPMHLGDIPGSAKALSFKAMPDGGLTIFLQPGDLAAFRQLVVQRALNAAAGE